MSSSNKFQAAIKPPNRELAYSLPPGSKPNPNLAGFSTGAAMPEGGVTAVALEGAEEDEMMRDAAALSREEVMRRRVRRVRQLESLYRRQYWALVEEMRVRHRDYYWEFGVSPVEEGRGKEAENGGVEEGGENGRACVGGGLGFRKGESNNIGAVERKRCAFPGCKSKAMPLTRYCHPHILSDSKQTLYKPCSYVIRRYGLELALKV